MTIQVGVALVREDEQIFSAKEALRLARANLNSDKINLAIAFSSVNLAYSGFLKTISASLIGVPVIGCSAAAILSHQGISKRGLVLMLLSFPKEVYFNTACVSKIKAETALNAGEELGEKLLYGLHDVRRDLSVIFSAGLIEEGSNFILGLQEKLGRSFPLIGGYASDNLTFRKSSVYFNEEVLSEAACGIVLGGKLNFGIGVKHGWKPLGKPRRVTKSNGNVVYEIDRAPAATIYEEYLATDLINLKKELKHISILYPVGIYLAGEEEYLLRNLLFVQDDGSLIFQGNVPQDSQIRLMIGTKESCLQATQQALDEVKRGLGSSKVNFVLVFDSISRYILLGRQAEKEIKIIRAGLAPETQLIGIYTQAEQAPLTAVNYQGRTYLHNQTITILGLGG